MNIGNSSLSIIKTDRKSAALILACLFATILMDQASLLLIVPLLPSLIGSISGGAISYNSEVAGLLVASYGVMQFIFAPIMGGLSDRFGRKKVLSICFAIYCIDYMIFYVADSIALLFLGRIIAGITGSSLVVSMASVADISNKNNKTKNFALMYSAIGLGMILGPSISSFSLQWGLRFPFIVAAILSFLCFLAVIFIYRETLAVENRRNFEFKNPLSSINKFLSYSGLGWLFLCHFFVLMAFQAPLVLWAFFTKYRFSWNEQQIANSLIIMGILIVLVQFLLIDFIYKKIGNVRACYLGYAMFISGLLLMSFAKSPYLFYIALIPYSLGSINNSALTSIYSNAVHVSEQGEIQGALTSITSITNVIGPIMMAYIFSYGIDSKLIYGDSIPYLIASFLTLLAVFFFRKGVNKLRASGNIV